MMGCSLIRNDGQETYSGSSLALDTAPETDAAAASQGFLQRADLAGLDPAMIERLVHVSGEAKTAAGVTNEDLQLRSQALALARRVELFQCVETENESGQDRSFTYAQQWVDSPIDPSRFRAPRGSSNTSGFTWQLARPSARDAVVEALPLGASVQWLSGEQPFRLIQATVDAAQAAIPGQSFLLDAGRLYPVVSPDNPAIGNERITFTSALERPISFVGRQRPNGIEPYHVRNGREILLEQKGLRGLDKMFEQAQDANASLTWIFRGRGLVGVFIAFNMLFWPVKLLAGFVPVLGNLDSGATSHIAGASMMAVGPLVIAVAWFTYPSLISIIVLGLGLTAASLELRRKKIAGVALVSVHA